MFFSLLGHYCAVLWCALTCLPFQSFSYNSSMDFFFKNNFGGYIVSNDDGIVKVFKYRNKQ